MPDDTGGRGHPLTRAMLLAGGLDAMASRAAPGMRLLTDAERAESLNETLAAHPDPASLAADGAWLFAYGSLLWNPTVHIVERRLVRVAGWQRRFCLNARAGRGTADNPGLLLGLIEGEHCDGLALRVEPGQVAVELDLLWRREMLNRSYVPRWLHAIDGDGRSLAALAFTMDPASRGYAGELTEDAVVDRLATARGELGTCADYLFHTEAELRVHGIDDPALATLADRVRARLAEIPPARIAL